MKPILGTGNFLVLAMDPVFADRCIISAQARVQPRFFFAYPLLPSALAFLEDPLRWIIEADGRVQRPGPLAEN